MVQPSPSSQTTGVPPQLPPSQVSFSVHSFSSLQVSVLLAVLTASITPVIGTLVPIITVRGCSRLHRCLLNRSPRRCTHRYRYNRHPRHTDSRLIGVNTHPVKGLQVSVVQPSPSSQLMEDPAQLPPAQLSPAVHLLFIIAGFRCYWRADSLHHTSHRYIITIVTVRRCSRHTRTGLHITGLLAGTHIIIVTVAVLITLQPAIAVNTHPVKGLQVSTVQPSPSSQLMDDPVQSPPLQVSPAVQAFSSSQARYYWHTDSLLSRHRNHLYRHSRHHSQVVVPATHWPVCTLQVSSPVHTSSSVQSLSSSHSQPLIG